MATAVQPHVRARVFAIAAVAALGGFLFGFETAVISGAEKIVQKLWSLNSFWQGFTVASSLIGTVIGSLIAGSPAQKYGRKKTLNIIALLYLVSAVGCALTYTWELFVAFRFIGGIAVGASSVVGPMYISEVSPARMRGRLTASFQLMIVTGIFVAYLTNFLFADFGDSSWRWMLVSADRDLAATPEEPCCLRVVEILRLGHEGDAAWDDERHEQPVGERQVVAGQDGRALGGDVLGSLGPRTEDQVEQRTERQELEEPIEHDATLL